MWLRRLSYFLLNHTWQVVLLIFIGAFVPVLGMLAILAATFVTLCKGAKQGGILTLAATLPYIITLIISGYHDISSLSLTIWAAVGVVVLSNVLTYVFALMLRRDGNVSNLLQIAALFGVLIISLIHLAYPDIASWWGEAFQQYYAEAKNLMITMPGETGQHISDIQQASINATKFYATGLIVVAILFNAVVQLIIARWWQAFAFKPGMLRKELQNIRLSPLAGILFAASLGLVYWGNLVISDIMPVVYLLFAAAGLSLIHYFFSRLQMGSAWFWLMIVYIALFLLLPNSAILLALLAVADCWFDVRKRLLRI